MKQYVETIKKIEPSIFKPLEIYLDCIRSKDCDKCGIRTSGIIQFPKQTKRIVVFGDIHGDFELLLSLFLKANVINEKLEWIGEDTYVVQMGDFLDRGGRPNSIDTEEECEELQIIQFLDFINKKAQQFDGKVLCLLGNHELMNLMGDFRYTSINTNKCFKNRKAIFSPGSELCHKIACITYGILKIDDWVFVHGGLLPKHIESYREKPQEFIKKVNDLTQKILKGTKQINELTEDEKNILLSEEGILWTRHLNNNCNYVNDSYDILQLKKGGIVVGHTPVDSITSKCNENYWMVDTGASKAFGNKKTIQFLEIIKENDNYLKNIIS